MPLVSLNGNCIAQEDAVIGVDDRGFRFGDGVFETVPVHGGRPYLWEYHKERLEGGLKALAIACDTGTLLEQAIQLLTANRVTRGMLRVQISRGSGSRGYLPSGASEPTVVLQTLDAPPSPEKPVALWLSSYEKPSPRALPTRFKLAQGLNSTLARMEAEHNGCHEALLLASDGSVSEASAANIFWRAGTALYTPSLATGALAGVTRRRIIELAGSPMEEGVFSLARLQAADAVILTNAATGATAVEKLLPTLRTWSSRPLAEEINTLIKEDINRYLAERR